MFGYWFCVTRWQKRERRDEKNVFSWIYFLLVEEGYEGVGRQRLPEVSLPSKFPTTGSLSLYPGASR